MGANHGDHSMEGKMNYKSFLQIFEDGGGDAGAASTQGAGAGSKGYSFEQAEEIANARAERAKKAALSSYFKQQGMSEDEVTQALADFRQKKAAAQPNTAALEKENEALKKQIEDGKNREALTKKGVSAEYVDYVAFEVSKNVSDKATFEKAADAFLKEHPAYMAKSMRVTGGATSGADAGSHGGSGNQSMNDWIRQSARR